MKNLIIKFRARIKKSRIKKCHQRRIRNWIKRRHSIKRKMINKFLKKQLMHFLQMILIEKTLKNISSNYWMIWLIDSIFIIEAKLLSMLHVDKKLIWWIHFFQKFKFNSNQKIMIYNDNLQTIRFFFSEFLKIETKFQHVDIAQCWLKQLIQSDYFSMNYVFIAKMITNKLTKILSSQKHRKFINQLKFVDAEFLIKAIECD